MTKREYLESIGYETVLDCTCYQKYFIGGTYSIHLKKNEFWVYFDHIFYSQKDIDNLQIAFNNVKRDFEEMQKYED